MVVAGPGTGKTQVLGLRVANILSSRDISPNNILCLTFTDAGAVNMRERLERFIGADAYRVGIYTFHAFCNATIGRYPEYFYNAATYAAADDIARAEIIEQLFAKLPHGHPLASHHPDEGYVYRRDVIERIKHIKSAGFTPEEYMREVESFVKEMPKASKALAAWPERLAIKSLAPIEQILGALLALDTSYGLFLAKTLSVAYEEAQELGKTGPLGDWKKKFTEKGDDDVVVLKDLGRIEKMKAVAAMYKDYEDALHAKALYDYDDMIIDVRCALEENSTLRNMLEEQYQYILVDEFQDTNEAQMKLVVALSSNPVHEGRPNVMVVGDDDQAIFKFQGAELSNILNFERMYKDVQTIVLDKNFRSHKSILDAARSVVLQGAYRLETERQISKELVQGNTALKSGDVHYKQYGSDVEEFAAVAAEIRALIEKGEDPKEIAVIAHKHAQLQDFLPYLEREGVPYAYIRRASVFDEPHIRARITVCDYLASLTGEGGRKDELLPRLLSLPTFGLSRTMLFRIAVRAKDERKSWSEVIGEIKEPGVERAFALLAQLGGSAESMPLEHLLDEYMRESGFRMHYFGKDALKEKPAQYVAFLASLKSFIEALRGWREGEPLFARDVAPFVALHREQGIGLISTSPFVKGGRAVQVMSAHKSKGLEFGSVFIIGAHESVWAKGGRANKAPVPAPLIPRISPAGEDEDDFIRILYVALTRAKHRLSVTGHDKLVKYLGAISDVPEEDAKIDIESAEGARAILAHEQVLSLSAPPYVEDELAVLKEALSDYRLSVTHLNNFLDVTANGPAYFLEQNLLHFPQPMSVAGTFGSAIDSALTELIRYPKYNAGEVAPLERIIAVFKRELAKGRLPADEARKQIRRGEEVLAAYMKARKGFYLLEDESQVDFRNEGVVIEGAPLSGKIDFLRTQKDGFDVVDFKTGKTSEAWEATGMDVHEKVKLHKYKQQLLFYRLLLNKSARHAIPVKHLALEFVESALDGKVVQLAYTPSDEELERLSRLIGVVYKKIMALDFPDVAHYEQNVKGIIAFEEDLLSGKI
jgi:DNA helicase-2/ATP-dependent DNA helicase PcrA